MLSACDKYGTAARIPAIDHSRIHMLKDVEIVAASIAEFLVARQSRGLGP